MRAGLVRLTKAVSAMMVWPIVLVAYLAWPAVTAFAQCSSPPNAIVAENCLPGNPSTDWQISGSGDPSIQGFATDISVNAGQTISFKINTNAANYTIDIYRLGYYGGMGARKVASVTPSAQLPQTQPACLSDATAMFEDCGNWAVSAAWTVPANAVSGYYLAHLIRSDTGGDSHIYFIVRNDASHSALLFQASDETWAAYNDYGGHSLYGTAGEFNLPGRGLKVSYNRPSDARNFQPATFLFNGEYPMIRWLEANGYDVTYFTGVDAARYGNLIQNHKVYLSVGHDEYWSGPQRTNVEAARDAGVNLAFFSGNEVFWKVRWENSVDGSNTPYRTMVCYKETLANAVTDPADPPTWTGTWRDPRFSPPADGGRPENSLTGTLFEVNGPGADNTNLSIQVPAADGQMRFWRNTSIATQSEGQTATLPAGTLGYEWDVDADNGFRPAGLFHLSTATYSLTTDLLLDYGGTYGAGTATHSMTLYRAPSGALVFGAGTVQWAWGLDGEHDGTGGGTDVRMQQATVNLLADMGTQPGSIQPGLVPAMQSSDTVPPMSTISSPSSGSTVIGGTPVTITGTAADLGGGVVGGVEVSVDGGQSWHLATGRGSWTYTWTPGVVGSATVMSRAVDDSGNIEVSTSSIAITVAAHDCPCDAWTSSTTPSLVDSGDANALEIGVRFRTDYDGYITGIRFYKSAANTGTHLGHLWSADGTMLASVTFTGETGSGWQQASFSSPVPVTANTVYVGSYYAPAGHYSATDLYFASSGIDDPPVHLLGGASGPNGVYVYGASAFPNQTYNSTNYWVDVVYFPSGSMPGAPSALAASPASLAFSAYAGQQNPPAQTVSLYSQGSSALSWSASVSAPWLIVSAASGTTPASLSVSVNTASLTGGIYTGTVTVTAPGAANSPQVISVTLTLTSLLLSSNFNAGTMDGWAFSPLGLATNWTVVNQALQYNGGGHTQVYAGNSAWADYTVQADIKLATLNDYPGGIRGRVNPSTGAAYTVWLYPHEGLLKLYRNTAWNIDAGVVQLGQAAAVFDAQNFHTVALTFTGSQIQVSYDGNVLITATDSTYASGMIALDVSSQAITFDNVLVTSLNAAPAASLMLSPITLNFSGNYQGSNPSSQTAQLSTGGSGIVAWSAASTAPWLSVSPASGSGAAPLQVSVDLTQLSGGTYSGTIRVGSFGAGNSPQSVSVGLTVVVPPPSLVVSPASMNFVWVVGQPAPSAQNLTVANGGGGAISWIAGKDAAWLTLSATAGNAPSVVSTGINTTSLTPGTYAGHVTISAAGVGNSPQSVPVVLVVLAQDMSETFADLGTGWVVSPMGLGSGWSVSNGVYSFNGSGLSQSCAGNSNWTDYTFDTNIKLSNLSNWPGGVRGRVNPSTGAGYAVWLYPGTSQAVLYRVPQWNINGPGLTALAQTPLSFDTNTHDLQMAFQGSQIFVYWDGNLLMSAADASYAGGYVCMDADSQPIAYSNVRVAAVQSPVVISVAPASAVFSASPGSTPVAQTINVNGGGAATTWGISVPPSSPWLSAVASSSLTPGTITLSINAAGLAEGTYTANVSVYAPGAAGPPVVIPVTLGVKVALLAVSPSTLTFFAATGSDPANQAISITNAGTGNLAWTASADSPWIGTSATSGTAPGSLPVSVNTTGLATGQYQGNVTIASNDVANGPIAVPVTLQLGTQLFLDTFNSASNWTISPMGNASGWSVANGFYTYNGMGASQSWAGNDSWTDYTVAADFKLTSMLDYPGGLRGRVNTTTGAGYGVWIYPAERVLKLYRIGQWSIDADNTLLAQAGSINLDTTGTHNLRLSFSGSHIQVYYDQNLVIDVTDSSYTQGAIALDGSNQVISFTNVGVIGF
jgi:N,N-dimethylformamidase beta subunit-like, C-terminal/Domain of unknown function (DUF4082)/Bacterial Ig domain/Viral BACON domain/3-keto-disaccharide hydrolase